MLQPCSFSHDQTLNSTDWGPVLDTTGLNHSLIHASMHLCRPCCLGQYSVLSSGDASCSDAHQLVGAEPGGGLFVTVTLLFGPAVYQFEVFSECLNI
jgi:hypothetical protein